MFLSGHDVLWGTTIYNGISITASCFTNSLPQTISRDPTAIATFLTKSLILSLLFQSLPFVPAIVQSTTGGFPLLMSPLRL